MGNQQKTSCPEVIYMVLRLDSTTGSCVWKHKGGFPVHLARIQILTRFGIGVMYCNRRHDLKIVL